MDVIISCGIIIKLSNYPWYLHQFLRTQKWRVTCPESGSPENTVNRKWLLKKVSTSWFERFMCTDSPYQSRWPHNLLSKHLTFKKCRVARNSGESVSWAFAHCSANGVRASRHSWQTSELILIMKVKEQMQVDTLDILKTKNYSYYHMECMSRNECR